MRGWWLPSMSDSEDPVRDAFEHLGTVLAHREHYFVFERFERMEAVRPSFEGPLVEVRLHDIGQLKRSSDPESEGWEVRPSRLWDHAARVRLSVSPPGADDLAVETTAQMNQAALLTLALRLSEQVEQEVREYRERLDD